MTTKGSFTKALTTLLACATVCVAPCTTAYGTTDPAPATAPANFSVYQMNMCMWGAKYYVKAGQTGADTCFPDPYVSKDSNGDLLYASGYTDTEKEIAAAKRSSIISQVERFTPDAVTLNEACKGDMESVVTALRADGLNYTFKSFEVGRGRGSAPRPCSVDRGDAVNGIIAHGFVSDSKQAAYFETDGYRSWVCATVNSGVRVCTAHLSLAAEKWGGYYHQPIECAELRDNLASTSTPTVFAGDVNMKGSRENCAPSAFWGLKDIEYDAADRNGLSGLQHIYYSPDFTRADSCGQMHIVAHTDHKGFLLDLQGVPTRTRGAACDWRDVWQ